MKTIHSSAPSSLPHLAGRLFLTDGGLETTLIFLEKRELPEFAAFVLLGETEGREWLRRYYRHYAGIAARYGCGFVLETPTWRASADWAQKLGIDHKALAGFNRDAVGLLYELREETETPSLPMVLSGNLGPRGDGYRPTSAMSPDEAARYHGEQIAVLRDAGADFISAFTINYVEEALGIANAAAERNFPAVISFTVETDGRLPSGMSLQEAVTLVDERAVRAPAYYMVNCAHPDHVRHAFSGEAPWLGRIRGLRVNASRRSHAELDSSTDLDDGNPAELGNDCRSLARLLPEINVLGGCCGTDYRHVEAMAKAWQTQSAVA